MSVTLKVESKAGISIGQLVQFIERVRSYGVGDDALVKAKSRFNGTATLVSVEFEDTSNSQEVGDERNAEPVVLTRADLTQVHDEYEQQQAVKSELPDDNEPIYLSGRGKVTYAEAREMAKAAGLEVVVSASTAGEPPHRTAYLQAAQPVLDGSQPTR